MILFNIIERFFDLTIGIILQGIVLIIYMAAGYGIYKILFRKRINKRKEEQEKYDKFRDKWLELKRKEWEDNEDE